MKPGQGKQKGGSFERIIGAKLSLWLSRGERRDLICRTVGSGSQFTCTNGLGNPGDLMPQHELAFKFFQRFIVECKHWKNLSMHHFLQGKGDLWEAWLKIKKEAETTDRSPWLVARQNHQPDLLFCSTKPLYPEFLITKKEYPNCHCLFNKTVNLYQLDEFFNKINPEQYF